MRKNWKFYLALPACTVMATAIAQTGTIKGVVKDFKTKQPVEYAGTLFLKSNNKLIGEVEEGGRFTISNVPEGKQSIVIDLLGYNDSEKDIVVKANADATVEILIMEVKTEETGTVTVSTGKHEQRIEEIIGKVEVIGANISENKAVTNMSQAVDQAPGVTIVDNEPQIRGGSGYSFGAGSRVMVMVDDLPLLSGDAGRPAWGFLPTENISQIEVSKGASSVLYGSAAINGVINLRTAYPTDTPLTKLTMFSGFYDTPGKDTLGNDSYGFWKENRKFLTGMNFVHSKKIGQLDLVIGGNIFFDNGYIGGAPEEIYIQKGPNPQQVIIDGKTIVIPAGTDSVKAYKQSTQDGEYDHRGRINVNLRYRSKKILGLAYGVNTNVMINNSANTFIWQGYTPQGLYRSFPGSVTASKGVLFTIDPFLTYTSDNGIKHSLKTRHFSTDYTNSGSQSNQAAIQYGEYQFQKSFLDTNGKAGLVITTGIVATFTKAQSQLYKGNEAANGANKGQNLAAYLQLEKRFWDKLNVVAGARYEKFTLNATSLGKPVFRFGANWQLGNAIATNSLGRALQATYLSASWGQGFRFPTIAEKYIRAATGAVQVYPNKDLEPETATGIDISLKQGFKIGSNDRRNFKGYIDVTYFQQTYTNNVEFNFGQWGNFATDPLFGLGFRSLNVGKTRTSGIDASILGQGLIGKVKINTLLGYTYMNPVSLEPNKVYAQFSNDSLTFANTSSNPTNNILKYRFQHLVKADIEGNWKGWMFGVSVRYNSAMQNVDKRLENIDQLLALTGTAYYTNIAEFRKKNNKGATVVDLRLGFNVNASNRISLVINNAMNNVYSLRPARIEAPRTFMFQYMAKF